MDDRGPQQNDEGPTTRETVLVVMALAALVIALVVISAPAAIELTGHFSHTV